MGPARFFIRHAPRAFGDEEIRIARELLHGGANAGVGAIDDLFAFEREAKAETWIGVDLEATFERDGRGVYAFIDFLQRNAGL